MDGYMLAVSPREGYRVPLRNGSPFYKEVTVTALAPGQPAITFLLGVEDGRPVLNGFHVDRWRDLTGDGSMSGPAVSPALVHGLALERLVDQAIAAAAQDASVTIDDRADGAGTKALQNRANRRLTPEVLRDVAEVVRHERRRAQLEGGHVRSTQAIVDSFGVSSRTASRYIKSAYDEGFLDDQQEES
jgi:hypothetical protein